LRNVRDNEFAERRKAAAEAKQGLLKKFATAPKIDDPEMARKRAEREALAVAREARRLEREQAKLAERERQAEEAAAQAAAREAEAEDLAKRAIEEEAARKAERDRRYQARKLRQR
jgi:hypothetical protein